MRGEPFLYPAAVSRLIRHVLERAEEPADPLTPRELHVVKLIAEAHRTERIAAIIVISPRTSSATGRTSRRSWACATGELTGYAIRRGIVDSIWGALPMAPSRDAGHAGIHR